MLELIDVSIETRHPIAKHLSYLFDKQNIYGVIAPNGSGKTTLFRSIVGLHPIQKGKILINHQPVNQQRNKIFYLETPDWLDQNMTSLDYLSLVKKEWHSQVAVDSIIERCQLSRFIKLPIHKYSLGMKQRLIFALYLISDAEILLFDETLNGLDTETREIFHSEIIKLAQADKLIIISSHYHEELHKICTKMLRLHNFQLEEGEENGR